MVDRQFIVGLVVGSIPHGGPIGLFLITASASRLGKYVIVCGILSVGMCI